MHNDYYVYERATTSGSTVYEPLERHADPDTAQLAPSFKSRELAERWIALNTGRIYAEYRHTVPSALTKADVFVGYLSEHEMWESMQRHGLRYSELGGHIADVKAGAVIGSDDGHEWRLVVGPCEWFARCERPAAGTVAHPVLGDVPTCQECARRFDLDLRTA